MKYTIEQLSFIVPAISIGFLAIITSINLYFKIRKKFPLTVNCWFCNENSRIPYLDYNKWTCKKCEQYNGFTEDGDYNCDIPAQRSSKLNKWKNKNTSISSLNGSIVSNRMTPTNGLCQPCNRNQELKVQQLASFEPQNEAYFDEEIEEYRTKLEQAYRLCPRCERNLRRTLNKVKTNILGSKLKQIGAKGIRAFDLSDNGRNTKRPIQQKRHLFARIAFVTLITISLLQTYVISNQIDITKAKLDSIFNDSTTTLILMILSYFAAVKILIVNFFDNFLILPYISIAMNSLRLFINYLYTLISGDIWTMINISITNLIEFADTEPTAIVEYPTLMLNLAGCFMSTFILFLTGLKFGSILSLLLWSFNMVLPSITHDVPTLQYALIFDLIQLSLTWSLAALSIVNTFTNLNKDAPADTKNTSFHRLDSESNSDASESEAESELETSIQSNSSSIGGNRSSWNKTHVLNSTIASSAASIATHVASLQQLPFAASTQSLCSFRASSTTKNNTSFGSVRDINRSSHMEFRAEKIDNNQSAAAFITSSHNQLNRTNCIPSSQYTQQFPEPDIVSRCTSRNSLYDVPDDFESGITQLSISGIGAKHINYRKQTRIFGSSDRIRDSLQKSILAPSRLSTAENMPNSNQPSSWLAGGFWNNNTSPQKRCISQMSHFPPSEHNSVAITNNNKAFEVLPMMSRTSSHSSGFESMRTSTNNSRENSLCDDAEVERTFLFCEPAARVASPIVKPYPNRTVMNETATFSPINGINALKLQNEQNVSFQSIASPTLNDRHDQQNNQFQNQTLPILQITNCNNVSMMKRDKQFNHNQSDFPMQTYRRGSLIKLNMTMDH